MSISATRSTPQDIESLLIFKLRPQIKDSKALSSLAADDVVTAEHVKKNTSDITELAKKIPAAPTTDGAYVLTCTVSGTTVTYSWESGE